MLAKCKKMEHLIYDWEVVIFVFASMQATKEKSEANSLPSVESARALM